MIFYLNDVARCMIEHFYTNHLTIQMTIDKKEVEIVLSPSLFVSYICIFICSLRY